MAVDRLETRIDPAVKAAAVEEAKAQKRSLSNLVELALEAIVAEGKNRRSLRAQLADAERTNGKAT